MLASEPTGVSISKGYHCTVDLHRSLPIALANQRPTARLVASAIIKAPDLHADVHDLGKQLLVPLRGFSTPIMTPPTQFKSVRCLSRDTGHTDPESLALFTHEPSIFLSSLKANASQHLDAHKLLLTAEFCRRLGQTANLAHGT